MDPLGDEDETAVVDKVAVWNAVDVMMEEEFGDMVCVDADDDALEQTDREAAAEADEHAEAKLAETAVDAERAADCDGVGDIIVDADAQRVARGLRVAPVVVGDREIDIV